MRLPRRRRGQRNGTSADVIAAVRHLVLLANDDLIAGILNRNGLVTGHGNRWTRERVTSLRSHHRVPVHKPTEDGNEPWLNLSKPLASCMSRPRRSDRLPRPARSRRSIPCPTVPGSLLAPISQAQKLNPSPNERGKPQDTPRNHIPTNNAYFHQ